jgi:hypothetical protein
MEKNWITFPDGYSCDLNEVRSITSVYRNDTMCTIILRFAGSDKSYEWDFPFEKHVETKEELVAKVDKLREKLVVMANGNKAPLLALSYIDLKKKDEVVKEVQS